MKIVVNKNWSSEDYQNGIFALSDLAKKELGIENDYDYYYEDEKRSDPKLVEVVERLGEGANGCGACLEIIEIPDDVDWEIGCDSSGYEWVAEKHRTW